MLKFRSINILLILHSVNSSNSPEVKGFVSGIEPDLVGVNKLIKKIQKMTVPAERSKIGFEEARKAYSAKNIDKFIREGRIPVPYTVRGEPMWGCYQQSMVLYYSMKALGFKPRICREVILPNIVHTRIWFRKNGQIYEADPYYQGTVRKINADRKKNVKEQMKQLPSMGITFKVQEERKETKKKNF